MDSLSGLFWDFGSLCQRRRGVVSFTLSRQPYITSTSLRRLQLGVAAQASGTSLSDVSAFPDVEASQITRRRATAISTLLTCRGAAARSTPLTPSVVVSLSWPDRGHHVPALTMTSSGRGVGFDEASSGTPSGFTPATQLELFNQLQLSLYRVSLCSHPGGPAATRLSATLSLCLAIEAAWPRLPKSGLWTSVLFFQPTFNQHNLRLRHLRHGQSSFTAQGLSAASKPSRSWRRWHDDHARDSSQMTSLQLYSPDQSTTWRGITGAVVRDALAPTVPTSS